MNGLGIWIPGERQRATLDDGMSSYGLRSAVERAASGYARAIRGRCGSGIGASKHGSTEIPSIVVCGHRSATIDTRVNVAVLSVRHYWFTNYTDVLGGLVMICSPTTIGPSE